MKVSFEIFEFMCFGGRGKGEGGGGGVLEIILLPYVLKNESNPGILELKDSYALCICDSQLKLWVPSS